MIKRITKNITAAAIAVTVTVSCAAALLAMFCTPLDFNELPEGPDEPPAVVAPGAPAGVSALAISSNSIIITWNFVPTAAGYYVYRSESSNGGYSEIGDVTSSPTYMDSIDLSSRYRSYPRYPSQNRTCPIKAYGSSS